MNKPKHFRKPVRPAVVAAPHPPDKRPTHWGQVATWYDELVGDEGSEYQREVIWPGVLRMLELKRGEEKKLTVLDLACGQGALCRKLAGMGHEVVGVDAAEALIAAAKARQEGGAAVKYVVADVTKLVDDGGGAGGLVGEWAGRTFDAITVVLAIQNISPLSPVWKACHAMLRPGGMLVVVMMHPSFRVPRQSDWLWEEATHTQARTVRQYLSSSQIAIQTHPGLAAHGKDATSTAHFHRPLQAYVNTLGNAGLLIDHLEEWPSHKKSEAGPRQKALDAARKEIPMFLAMRARRVG